MKEQGHKIAALVNRIRIKVRFSETDAMGVVWHGNYVKYFEDGREAFGEEYGIDYRTVCDAGYTIPVVELNCKYKRSLTFGEEVIIETRYIPCFAAKILFDYTILSADGRQVMATGSTMQVFLNGKNELELTSPDFYVAWKRKWNL